MHCDLRSQAGLADWLLVAGGVYPSFWRGPWSGLPGCAPEQIIVAAKSLFTCCVSFNAAASMLAPDTHAVRVTGNFKAALEAYHSPASPVRFRGLRQAQAWPIFPFRVCL